MSENKILILLASLPPKHIKEFWKFINQTHPDKSKISRLSKYLKKYYPEFNTQKLSDQSVFNNLFSNDQFDSKRLHNLYSDFRKILKRFIYLKCFEEFPIEANFIQLKYFKKHGIAPSFERQLRETNRMIEELPARGMWYSLNKMRLAHEHYYHLGTDKIKGKNIEIFDALTHLNNFHAAGKLRYASEIFSIPQVVNAPHSHPIQFLEEIENSVFDKDYPYHYCYQLVLKLIKTRENAIFYELKNKLIEAIDSFLIDDKHILFTYLLNHCVKEVRNGNKTFYQDIFELYQLAIQQDIFISGGHFNPDHFNNIVDIACRLKEYQWTKSFIKTSGAKLEDHLKKAHENYCRCFMSFSEGTFRNEISVYNELIDSIKTKNPMLELRVRWLKLVTQYEIDKFAVFEEINKTEQYVRRNKIFTANYKKSVMLSLKMIKKMTEPNVDKSKLLSEFNANENYYYASWIKSKLEE